MYNNKNQYTKMFCMDMTVYYKELAKNMRVERAKLKISQLKHIHFKFLTHYSSKIYREIYII